MRGTSLSKTGPVKRARASTKSTTLNRRGPVRTLNRNGPNPGGQSEMGSISLTSTISSFRSASAVLLGVGMIALSACATSGSGDSSAEILNDTSHTFLVYQCKQENCRGGFGSKGLMHPGSHVRVGVSTVGVPNPYVVLDPTSKQRLGCLPIVFPKPRRGVVVRLSQRVRCGDSYGHDVPWPAD